MGPAPAPGREDLDLINAGKQPVTLLTGGCYFHHGDSFAMMRGGHLDICVLGAFQVSVSGDLANWHTGAPDAIPAVGGAMDLAIGAKRVCVMMEHQTKSGESKIVVALHVSAHRRRLRASDLHRPRGARRHAQGTAGGRDRRRPVLRRTATVDRRAPASDRGRRNCLDLETSDARSLHLRRAAHAHRPLRRRAGERAYRRPRGDSHCVR